MRRLGAHSPEVFPIGFGFMATSDFYLPADEGENIASIREALDQGINRRDTGDFYGGGHNEVFVGRTIEGRAIKPCFQ